MSIVTIPRSDLTVEEISAVLRRTLGSRYKVTPSMKATGFGKESAGDATTILVASGWLERANVRLVHDGESTEVHVSPGATYFGLIRLFHRVGLAHRVYQALEHAPELANPN